MHKPYAHGRTINIAPPVHAALKAEAERMKATSPFRISIARVAERLIERALKLEESDRYIMPNQAESNSQ
jgi:hypothetical protein